MSQRSMFGHFRPERAKQVLQRLEVAAGTGFQTLLSTETLLRYAEATGSKFHVRLSAA
jgi:hypothetical protein